MLLTWKSRQENRVFWRRCFAACWRHVSHQPALMLPSLKVATFYHRLGLIRACYCLPNCRCTSFTISFSTAGAHTVGKP